MPNIKFLFFLLFCNSIQLKAQSNPIALASNIKINRLLTVKNWAIRIEKDPITKHFFYAVTSGDIYELKNDINGIFFDTLVFNNNQHHVTYLQGFVICDSTMYVSGNNYTDSSATHGIISRGKLLADGSRFWDTLMVTAFYATAGVFDHNFSGLTLNPTGDSLFICSGARGDHGEVESRNGIFKGLRNHPLTTVIFCLPTHQKKPIYLPNDSLLLANSGYVFCRGVRNHFDMAFDANGHLFGLENSGDYDHNEEMNWLQKDHHYGFPWKMGDTDNPQQFSNFNPAYDKRINHYSLSWRLGDWTNDPAFTKLKPGLFFDEPIKNFGPDCDKYRDANGQINDASDKGESIGSFTAHRSPLGLVFDKKRVLDPIYKGDAFMLSWTKGFDSCGCAVNPDSTIGPFVDPSEDLVHLDLKFDEGKQAFTLNAKRIVGNFSSPVDAFIDSNSIYVLEINFNSQGALYKVELPIDTNSSGIFTIHNLNEIHFEMYPNPTNNYVNLIFAKNEKPVIKVIDIKGSEINLPKQFIYENEILNIQLNTSEIANGCYILQAINSDQLSYKKFIVSH